MASTKLGCHGMKCLGKLDDWPMFIVQYQVTDPKDVFATCRKYYTGETKDGYCMVSTALMHVMDEDFQLML